MNDSYACGSPAHRLERRDFLSGLVVSGLGLVGGLGLPGSQVGWVKPALATPLAAAGKRVLVVDMHGGLSQLESWDPKPGAETGGPFRAIPTSVPGLHISDLLPHTSTQMHHLSVIRSLNTAENDHGRGRYLIQTGHRQAFSVSHPQLGAIVAHQLQRPGSALPGNLKVMPKGGGGRSKDGGFLGPQYSSTMLSGGKMPNWSERPGGLSPELDEARRALRSRLDARFAQRRNVATTSAYAHSFDKAYHLMEQRDVFDLEQESAQDRERYGGSEFGRQCLLARRLLDHDIPCVQLRHSNFDTHNENFRFHLELMREFDQPFAMLIADLAERGLLDHTLVLVISEFGRTPRINQRIGRDHWSKAWSVVIGGAGIQSGAVIGATNDKGDEVTDRQVDQRHLHHTILQAIDVDSLSTFEVGGQSVPIADPSGSAIEELLV